MSLVLATVALPAAARELPQREPLRWRVSALPIGRLVSLAVAPLRYRPPAVGVTAIGRDQGWRSLSFPVGDHGLGVYLSIEGEAQFDIAYIDYADGGQDRIELAQASRGDGVFALAEYAADRPVARVSLLARAVTREARISVMLGR
ncbi:MAG: hypothetical protein ACHQ52_07045 [Candidatus Eisenbacteria bacterium]